MAEDAIEEAAKDAGKVLAKEVYQDGLQPAVKRFGNTLGALAGVVDTAFAPVRLLVYAFDTKEALLKERIGKVLHERNVPPERVIAPDITVAGPALQAMVFAADAAELRDMYAALLATAMDSQTARNAHPAFVDILRQLTPDEARIVRLFIMEQSFPVWRVETDVHRRDASGVGYMDTTVAIEMLSLIGHDAGCEHLELVPSYINNLCRLGLGWLTSRQFAYNAHSREMLINPAYGPHVEKQSELAEKYPVILDLVDRIASVNPLDVVRLQTRFLRVTAFGQQFCAACAVPTAEPQA